MLTCRSTYTELSFDLGQLSLVELCVDSYQRTASAMLVFPELRCNLLNTSPCFKSPSIPVLLFPLPWVHPFSFLIARSFPAMDLGCNINLHDVSPDIMSTISSSVHCVFSSFFYPLRLCLIFSFLKTLEFINRFPKSIPVQNVFVR